MKVLSVAIPCYNSAEYMSHAIDTLLTGGEDIEIIVVDDGSTKDNTLEIAKDYEKKFPTIVKANTPGKWRTWSGGKYRT